MSYDPAAYQRTKKSLLKAIRKYHRSKKGKKKLKQWQHKYRLKFQLTRGTSSRYQRYTKNELYQLAREFPMEDIDMYLHYHATCATYQQVAEWLDIPKHRVAKRMKVMKDRMREIMAANDQHLVLPFTDAAEMIVLVDGKVDERDGAITFSASSDQSDKLLAIQERAADFITFEEERFFLTAYFRRS